MATGPGVQTSRLHSGLVCAHASVCVCVFVFVHSACADAQEVWATGKGACQDGRAVATLFFL